MDLQAESWPPVAPPPPRVLASCTVTRPTVADTPAEVEAIFRSLPPRLRPERLDGWGGTVHFVIVGADKPEWTVVIADGSVKVDEGLLGEPGCVVKMGEKTFLNIEMGKKKAIVAFVKGKIRVTNVGVMRKYDRAFWKLYETKGLPEPQST